MHKTLIYPRGYSRSVYVPNATEFGAVEKTEGDLDWRIAYNAYAQKFAEVDSWAFHRDILLAAGRLFGRFDSWVYNQLTSNDRVHGTQLEYLVDTIRFIRTGKRVVQSEIMYQIMPDKPEEKHNVANARRLADTIGNLDDISPYVLGKWCAHKGGFDDLVEALNIFFGERRA